MRYEEELRFAENEIVKLTNELHKFRKAIENCLSIEDITLHNFVITREILHAALGGNVVPAERVLEKD